MKPSLITDPPRSTTGAGSNRSELVEKVARILGVFEVDEPVLGLSDLARATGLPKATTFRIAAALVAQDFLERDGDQYVLGPRLFELGQRVPRARLYRDTALPFMEDLYIATGQTVHLAIPDGLDVFYLEKIMGHDGISSPSRVAGRMPLHCTASGKAILAYGAPELVSRVMAAGLPTRTRYTIRSAGQLASELEVTQERGYAIEREEARLGHGSIAGPVLGRSGQPIAALSVTTVLTRGGDPAQWAAPVKKVCARLGQAMATTRW